ncbi:MAG: oxidoreductase [Candidatus Altiarchaeota archaeon]
MTNESTCRGYLIEKLGRKPKVGIFSLTSCEGCQIRILDLEENLLDIFSLVDIVNFHLTKGKNEEGPFDISFVEGAVVRKDEIEKLKEIRAKSKYLIALGTCASYGGVPSIKDFGFAEEIEKEVYHDPSFLDSLENVYGIGHYVEVDYYLRGCPITKEEFLKVLKYLLIGNIPRNIEYPVCFECRMKENKCFLVQEKNKLCMGPITFGGCDAPCPSAGTPCYGCRGPLDDANVDALVDLFKDKGFSREDIERMFIKFAGTSKKFANVKDRLK